MLEVVEACCLLATCTIFLGLPSLSCRVLIAAIAHEIKDLWLEYEDCTSAEARVVKDLDKMEMIIQADEYEQGELLLCMDP